MNHLNSPAEQTNEAARNHSVPETSTSPSNNKKKAPYESKYNLQEDLQKIRRSNHSSHHARREVMDDNDDDHDAFIKGLMYPGLETSMDDYADFFEEDYDEELQAMESSMDMTPPPPRVPQVASYPNSSNNNELYSEESRLQADYYCDFYSSSNYRTRPRSDYPDMVGEKLRR